MTAINFTPVTLASTRSTSENAPREFRAQREARAKLMFTQANLEYLGQMPESARKAIAEGSTVALAGNEISKAKPGIAACSICGGVHKLSDPNLSGKITFYKNVKTNQVFGLSDTCRADYLGPFASKALVNVEKYLGDFPKAKSR